VEEDMVQYVGPAVGVSGGRYGTICRSCSGSEWKKIWYNI